MRTTFFAFAAMLLLGAIATGAEVRTFIDQSGRAFEGELLSVSGEMVTIKRVSDGLVFTVKAANFSRTDQQYFASKGGAQPAAAPTTPAPAANPAAAGTPMRIEAKVSSNKSDRPTNYYLDERTARISFRVDFRNGELQRPFTAGKATMMAFAKDLQDGAQSKVISREEFVVDLPPQKTLRHETKEVKSSYDNIAYKYGFKYSGYLLVLKDQTGKMVLAVGSSATIEKNADQLLKLSVDDLFDKNYRKLDPS